MTTTEAPKYSGPFNPPPADVLDGAIGWKFLSEPDGPGRWKPSAWIVVFPDHIFEVDYTTHIVYRDSLLHAI